MITDAQLIELDGIGQRVDSFVFELLNADRSIAGALEVEGDVAPLIEVNTQRRAFRTLTSLTVADPPSSLNLGLERVRPVMFLQNGSRYELGVLMFGQDSRQPTSPREPWVPQLYDESFLLDQGLYRSWSIAVGTSALAAFVAMATEVLEPLSIPWDYSAASDVLVSSPILYAVGSSRLDALNALAQVLGMLPPYFSNRGVHTLSPGPQPGATVDHTYGAGTRIFKDSTTVTSSGAAAPNRYIVTGDNIGGEVIFGVYDLPPAAPHSALNNGGAIIPVVHSVPGVSNATLAANIAYVDALTDQSTYGTAVFASAPDPRHDTFDTVELLRLPYLETGWTLACAPGGNHVHSLARLWS